MIRFTLLFVFFWMGICLYSQQKDEVIDIENFQHKLNREFADSKESPLTEEDFKHFKGLKFFPIRLKYRVKATFVLNENPIPFEMFTTTDRKPIYQVYGTLHFEIDRRPFRLFVYQNLDLMKKEGFENYLFVPFTDATNGSQTYGGGRYLDLEGPLEKEITLDFNKAYNPSCAYNYKYSCPIPPEENDMKIKIKAGVKKFH